MGFPQSQSEAAIQAYGTVQAALEALLAGKGEGLNEYKKKEQRKKDTKKRTLKPSTFVIRISFQSSPSLAILAPSWFISAFLML